jgi:predicted acetyltransferase
MQQWQSAVTWIDVFVDIFAAAAVHFSVQCDINARRPMPPPASHLKLLAPDLEHLAAYADALARGWSPNNVRDVSGEQLEAIGRDCEAFLASLLAQTGTISLPDGRQVPKLRSRVRWLWDGEFVGQVALRWQPGTDRLPDYVLGHIGFAVVPWKRRRGYATRALAHMLGEAREVGLFCVEITTDVDNTASQRVIEANGGCYAGCFVNASFGPGSKLRYLVDLSRLQPEPGSA